LEFIQKEIYSVSLPVRLMIRTGCINRGLDGRSIGEKAESVYWIHDHGN